MKDNFEKEFFASSWAIDNKTSIYIITIIISIAGIISYLNLPKEQFPDIVVPTIYVSTIYPGTSPKDMENLVTKPIENQIKSINGVKKFTSNSLQDFSNVIVEFSTTVRPEEAKQRVKDAVDKARTDLPADLPQQPNVQEIDFSEIPVLYINLSGDFDLNKLKKFAKELEERIEAMPEIRRVDIVGALDREIQINLDMFKMQAANVTLRDVQNAVAFENLTISGGTISLDGVRRSVSITGEFKDIETIKNLIVGASGGAKVYLKDIAEVKDGFKEQESYARLDGKNVITLNVLKKGGENLINAADKCREIIAEFQATNKFPKDLRVTITNDQSKGTRITLHDLINTIIIGFILVTVILMFFMGVTNAIFVALSVPLSMFLAFLIMPMIGFSLNMIVLFSFLLALGIVVDDAIVVIENTHRIFDNGKVPIKQAAKTAAGEVFIPVLSGTMTTLAPFVPLAFWQGIIGKFMFFLPITLIITLLASLAVAYIINPVFAVDFMKPHHHNQIKSYKGTVITSIIMIAIALIFYLLGGEAGFGLGNFTILLWLLFLLNKFILTSAIYYFQNHIWVSFQNAYANFLAWALKGTRPYLFLIGTIFLFFFSIVLTIVRQPKIEFFPKSDPNFIEIYTTLPIGTDQTYTDSITRIIEKRVFEVIGKNNPLVESVIANVTVGVSDPAEGDRSNAPNKSKVSIAFVEFSRRNGQSTAVYLDKVRQAVKDIPGAEIAVDQERNGPPVGKPISIEITGEDLDELVVISQKIKRYLDSLQIAGIEELKSDVQINKPQLTIEIDRERANKEGISTGQIGAEIRNAIFGIDKPAKFREANEEYPIQIRYQIDQRNNIATLMNHQITFRDMNMGGILRTIPLSAVANVKYDKTFGGIKRKNQKRIVTLSSNVLAGFNPNEVVANIEQALKNFPKPDTISISMGGEQEQQKETSAFLANALLISLGMILLILVTQFNSVSKPIIILSEVLFSIIGVLLGLSIFGMKISIVMTGVGIVALAGIVVRNGILLVEFADLLREQGVGLFEAVVEAGRTRMTPVLLTASATTLGLIPLAVGLNIDFVTLFTELNPHIFFGGDSVAFWGPLSWTMIFGLVFATFLTLVLVPIMYLLSERTKMKVKQTFKFIKPESQLELAEEVTV
ncbi:MAG: efflux RND transporter permease subunit [Microscillaceae bacterium]|nr:efflux RND transporter permease subunit [Microscillaceae bacterium]MDW8460905.1 efflux RND transporter permease subunit [Cytophagales bacterium]